MITTTKILLNVIVLALAVCLAGCGKDGDPGVGYTEAIKYGDIKATFAGKRPTDSVAFSEIQDFKFYAAGNNPSGLNSVYVDTTTGIKTFYIVRFLAAIDQHTNDNYVSVRLDVSATDTITYYQLSANTTIITGTKFFGISEYRASNDDSVGETSEITDFKYDATTGKVTFKFTWNTPASGSSTGYDLAITGAVSTTVLESLSNPNL
ncbi:MAG TPA: hypothetical protein VIM65_24565 [Cyclobacteriaceae bacterium]